MSVSGPSRLAFVTGNPGKLREAERLAERPLEAVAVDLPEIQSLDIAEVLAAKADEASRHVDTAFVVEETGLELEALNGFPGALVKWMLDAIGPEGIAQVAIDRGNASVRARCRLLYRDEHGEIEAEGVNEGTLVLPARGERGFGWDPVFQPDGKNETYGELSDDDKDRIGHRGRAWRSLLAQLASR